MNYDDINKVLEKKPWITIAMAFVVVSLCLWISFMHYGTKVNISTPSTKKVAMVENGNTTRMAAQHQIVTRNTMLPHQRPLLTSLTTVQCATHQQRVVPLCPRCNVPLDFLKGMLFQCPNCKQKTEVLCPGCGKPMSLVQGPEPSTDVIYYCPICRKEVVPNFEKNGTPICPYCNNPVVVP